MLGESSIHIKDVVYSSKKETHNTLFAHNADLTTECITVR